MTPGEAYCYALNHHTEPGFDLCHYQTIACVDPFYAYLYCLKIPGANIEFCQTHAAKSAIWSYYFAEDVLGSNISNCLKSCEKHPYWSKKLRNLIISRAIL